MGADGSWWGLRPGGLLCRSSCPGGGGVREYRPSVFLPSCPSPAAAPHWLIQRGSQRLAVSARSRAEKGGEYIWKDAEELSGWWGHKPK